MDLRICLEELDRGAVGGFLIGQAPGQCQHRCGDIDPGYSAARPIAERATGSVGRSRSRRRAPGCLRRAPMYPLPARPAARALPPPVLCATHVAPTSPFQKAICPAFFVTRSFSRCGQCADGDGLQTPKVQRIAAGRHAGDVVKRVVLILKVVDDFTLQTIATTKLAGCAAASPRYGRSDSSARRRGKPASRSIPARSEGMAIQKVSTPSKRMLSGFQATHSRRYPADRPSPLIHTDARDPCPFVTST